MLAVAVVLFQVAAPSAPPPTSGAQPRAITLSEAIAAAQFASPRLQRARSEREVARIIAGRERPRRGSGLSVAARGVATLQGPRLTFPERDEEATVLPRRRVKLELRGEQTLYQAGRSLATARADASDDAADLDLRRAEAELAITVARAFFAALSARASAETAARGAEQARAALRRIEALLDAGRVTPGERLQADADRAEAERLARVGERGIQVADAALNRLLGRPLDASSRLDPPAAVTGSVPDQERALAAALAHRADFLALRAQIRAAEAGEGLASLSKRPVVIAGAGYALQTPSAFVARSSWDASVGVTFPLWDSGRAASDRSEARARADGARNALQELEGGVAVELLRARFAVLDAREAGESRRRTRLAAAELLRAAEERFALGRATALEVITARGALRRAEAEEVRTRYDLALAWAELRSAMGESITEPGRGDAPRGEQ